MENNSSTENSSNVSALSSQTMSSLREITKILIIVSLLIIVAGSPFGLDFRLAILLGVGLVGLNFYITRRILMRVLLFKDLKRRMIILYLCKLGISAFILYVAIVYFELPGLGVLIGLSNIVITILVYSIKQALFPPVKNS